MHGAQKEHEEEELTAALQTKELPQTAVDHMNDDALDELLSCLVFQMGSKRRMVRCDLVSANESGSGGMPRTSVPTLSCQNNETREEQDSQKPQNCSEQEALFWSHYHSPVRKNRKSCIKARHNFSPPVKQRSERSFPVRFDKVEVRAYSVEPGDNPACRSGPALTLGWDYVTVLRRPVSEYEYDRWLTRREAKELVQTASIREGILKDFGFSELQISLTVEQIEKDRIRRRETVQNMKKYGRLDEKVEYARKKLLKFLHLEKNDRAMIEDLWFDAAADYYEEIVGFPYGKPLRSASFRRNVANPMA